MLRLELKCWDLLTQYLTNYATRTLTISTVFPFLKFAWISVYTVFVCIISQQHVIPTCLPMLGVLIFTCLKEKKRILSYVHPSAKLFFFFLGGWLSTKHLNQQLCTFVINPPYINLDFISTHQYMEIKDKI